MSINLLDPWDNTAPTAKTPVNAAAFSNTGPTSKTPTNATAWDNTGPTSKTPANATAFSNTDAVDNTLQTRALKLLDPVRVATVPAEMVDINTRAKTGGTIDGVVMVKGDRVLLKDASNAYDNGIYVIQDTYPMARAADMNESKEFESGMAVQVVEGTTNNSKLFQLLNSGTAGSKFVIGTTNVGVLNITTGLGWEYSKALPHP